MSKLVCSHCGGPLHPEPNAVRVTCSYCATVTEVVSETTQKLARQVEALGIRLPERVMTTEEIEEGFRQREREERERRRTALIIAAVLVPLFLLFLACLIASALCANVT